MPDYLKRTLFTILKVALVIFAIVLFFKTLKYIWPFILGYFFASLIEPIVKFLEKKIRIPRKIGTVFSILVVLGGFISISSFVIFRLFKEIEDVYNSINFNAKSTTEFFTNIVDKVNGIYIQLPVEISDLINQAVQNITSDVQRMLRNITDVAESFIQFAMNIPQIFMFILVTILATYFLSSDKNRILKFLDRKMPYNWLTKTRAITNNVFSGVFGWLRAQMIIMAITFTELLIGLSIIGIENSLLLALIIAVIDILPILGAGTVLVPWSIVNIFSGNTKLGLSTFLLYIIILFVRQLIEPKIVGQQIGVHPIFTLAGMYIGLQIFGVKGMLIGPLLVIIIKYLIGGILQDENFRNWYDKNIYVKKE